MRRTPYPEYRTADQRTARARETARLPVAFALPAAPLVAAALLARPAVAAALVAAVVLVVTRERTA